jgi:hypothetical protein
MMTGFKKPSYFFATKLKASSLLMGFSQDQNTLEIFVVVIATMETVQSVFHLPGRQAEGFLESLFMLMGIELAVPDHSTPVASFKQVVDRNASHLKGQSCSLVVNSTGVKVYGEGE